MWLILPFFLLFTYVILILWYRKAWLGLPEIKEEEGSKLRAFTKVSVIVPARNESLNIANCIESVLSQSYPADLLELIIVDDASDDDTA